MNREKTLPITLAVAAVLVCRGARADAPTVEPAAVHAAGEHKAPSTRLALSAQVLEIVVLDPPVRHQTALLSTGLSVVHGVSPKWTLIGGLNFATGLDSISLGGSVVFGADYNVVRRGAFRFGLGPDLVVVQSWFRTGPAGWGNVTVMSAALGVSLGYKGATFMVGWAPGYAPQRGGSWSMTPRVGISASF